MWVWRHCSDYALATSRSAGEALVAEEPLPLRSVSRLSMAFGLVRALDGIDLSIMASEVVALAGENGAGKTTLLRALGGDIKPTGGEIMFRGRPLPADPRGGRPARRRCRLAGLAAASVDVFSRRGAPRQA
jgi:ABC-type glutathione transport system ATPase component